jgi:hypothetical protein
MDPYIINLARAINLRRALRFPGNTALTTVATQMEKDKIWEKVRQADTSKLVQGLNETELIQQLVCRSAFIIA